ncbi:MAG: 3-dehydroquinate synthase [Candidatus Omnitrophota bacterium]
MAILKTVTVNLKKNSYPIITGYDSLGQCGEAIMSLACGQDAVIVTNPMIDRLYGRTLIAGLKRNGFSVKIFHVPDTEKSKSAKVAVGLLERIAKYDIHRKIFIVALGGGVIGDLAGFLAAVYKRGVPYIQVPTTFLAQIDSAIGGKTAIDLAIGKNLIGAFYQPRMVWSDVATLTTLSQRQMRNGLAEAIKYGVISDKNLFIYIQKNYKKALSYDAHVLMKIVLACSRMKAKVVATDEREIKGIRTILNFGHTAGHALEAAGRYTKYHHGEAIGLGMRIAAHIALEMDLLAKKHFQALNDLLTNVGLPQKITSIPLNRILAMMAHDKKFKGPRNRFVVPTQIGKVRVIENIPGSLIKKAITLFME